MNWLALETATEYCSVAVAVGDAVYSRGTLAAHRHSDLLLPMIDAVLAEAGIGAGALDAIACGVGPGGFTAVRIGVSTAQALAQALDLPVYAVSSLQALAAASLDRGVLAAFDARKGEVYAGVFLRDDTGWPQLQGAERVCPPEALHWPPSQPAGHTWRGMGSGWQVYGDVWQGPNLVAVDADRYPQAREVLSLARGRAEQGDGGLAPWELEPHYIRPSQAELGGR
ncbi:MAG: tRNA (adenosine(37)-N6)-threonylcarbamoyltransferase complex dimerization subunit type 1 TsaB [Acidithiobacillus sp.]